MIYQVVAVPGCERGIYYLMDEDRIVWAGKFKSPSRLPAAWPFTHILVNPADVENILYILPMQP